MLVFPKKQPRKFSLNRGLIGLDWLASESHCSDLSLPPQRQDYRPIQPSHTAFSVGAVIRTQGLCIISPVPCFVLCLVGFGFFVVVSFINFI